jgi:hypothetical protein
LDGQHRLRAIHMKPELYHSAKVNLLIYPFKNRPGSLTFELMFLDLHANKPLD